MHKTKILFNGHDFKFIKMLVEHLRRDSSYDVSEDLWSGHSGHDESVSCRLLEGAEIIFSEWCLGNAEWYSKRKRSDQTLIVRFHRQEIERPYIKRMKWENVDRIIFICQRMMDEFLGMYPLMKDRSLLIYNFIDCDTLGAPKEFGSDFNLGLLGASPKLKAPHIAFDIFTRLKSVDNRYTLYIKGKHPWEYDWLWKRDDERTYYESLYATLNKSKYANSIVFDPPGDDVPEWFSKIGVILSTSDYEGSHQAVAEGMASGSIPVIRDWAGVMSLYPERFVFHTIDQAVTQIIDTRRPAKYEDDVKYVKTYARERFDKNAIIPRYSDLFQVLRPGRGS